MALASRGRGGVVVVGALLALLATATCHGAREEAAEPPVCLVTGFEPFAGRPVNGSWEAVKDLDGQVVAGCRVVALRLPVAYDEVAAPLSEAIERLRPLAVISFGEGRAEVDVETTAKNGYHATRPLDERKKRPPRERIDPDGPGAIPTALPADRIVAALRTAGIAAKTSDDAGGYLCNECFYRVMEARFPAASRGVVRGFVHVPLIGAANPLGPAFDAATLRRAARIVLETALE